MINIYQTDIETNIMQKITEIKKGSWINMTNPTEEEISNICKTLMKKVSKIT